MLEEKLRQLEAEAARQRAGGGEKAARKQREGGRLTARERIDCFLDRGSFHEVGLFARHACTDFGMERRDIPADGVVTGFGTVDGRRVYVYAQDFTAMGGTMGRTQASKICRILQMALEAGAPVVGMNDSGGARIQEGVDALSGYGELFHWNVRCSGKIPQLTLIMGPCAGGAAYSPALTDLVLMTEKTSCMFCTGPGVLRSVTFEEVDAQTLGGARTHAAVTGEAHLTAPDDRSLLDLARRVLSYLPSSSADQPPVMPCRAAGSCAAAEHSPFSGEVSAEAGAEPGISASDPAAAQQDSMAPAVGFAAAHPAPAASAAASTPLPPDPESRPALREILPDSRRTAYDMKKIIGQIADEGSILEFSPLYAENLVTALCRIGGWTAGVFANQPLEMAGCLDAKAAVKGARFIRFCDSWNIPLVSLVDTPGFLPGTQQEYAGILRCGADMLRAVNSVRVPLVTVFIRKAYGGAYMAMGSRDCGAKLVLAWPTAEIAVMGAEDAVDIIYKKEISASEDPEAERARLAGLYMEKFSSPYFAAGRGHIDMIIDPADTRREILAALFKST